LRGRFFHVPEDWYTKHPLLAAKPTGSGSCVTDSGN